MEGVWRYLLEMSNELCRYHIGQWMRVDELDENYCWSTYVGIYLFYVGIYLFYIGIYLYVKVGFLFWELPFKHSVSELWYLQEIVVLKKKVWLDSLQVLYILRTMRMSKDNGSKTDVMTWHPIDLTSYVVSATSLMNICCESNLLKYLLGIALFYIGMYLCKNRVYVLRTPPQAFCVRTAIPWGDSGTEKDGVTWFPLCFVYFENHENVWRQRF